MKAGTFFTLGSRCSGVSQRYRSSAWWRWRFPYANGQYDAACQPHTILSTRGSICSPSRYRLAILIRSSHTSCAMGLATDNEYARPVLSPTMAQSPDSRYHACLGHDSFLRQSNVRWEPWLLRAPLRDVLTAFTQAVATGTCSLRLIPWISFAFGFPVYHIVVIAFNMINWV